MPKSTMEFVRVPKSMKTILDPLLAASAKKVYNEDFPGLTSSCIRWQQNSLYFFLRTPSAAHQARSSTQSVLNQWNTRICIALENIRATRFPGLISQKACLPVLQMSNDLGSLENASSMTKPVKSLLYTYLRV